LSKLQLSDDNVCLITFTKKKLKNVMVTKENSKGDKNDYFNIYEEQSSIVSVTDILVTVTKSFFCVQK